MEKIIELKSMELADILGIGDGHIKLIESSVPVSITARGELLTIKGKSSSVISILSIFHIPAVPAFPIVNQPLA